MTKVELRACCKRPAGAFYSTPDAPRDLFLDGSEAPVVATLNEPPAPDEEVAYHEAGHAVAYHYLGAEIEHVTIARQPHVRGDTHALALPDQIVMLLAGPAATDAFHHCEFSLPETDLSGYFERVDAIVFGRCDHCRAGLTATVAANKGGADRQALFREGERRAIAFVRERPVWLAIRALAAELMQSPTLSGKRCHSIIEPFVRFGSLKEDTDAEAD